MYSACKIVGALGDARVEGLERTIEEARRFFRLPHAMVGGADLHRDLDARALLERVIARPDKGQPRSCSRIASS